MYKKLSRLLCLILIVLFIVNFSVIINNIRGQNPILVKSPLHLSNGDLLVLNLNLNRIDAQLNIILNKINNQDKSFLFEHAYIIHSTILPAILNFTNVLNQGKSIQLQGLISDLPMMIKSNENPIDIKKKIIIIENNIQYFYSKIRQSMSTKEYQLLSSRDSAYLLDDSKVSYSIYINSTKASDKDLKHLGVIDYENTLALVNKSKSIYNTLKPEMHTDISQKIDLSFKNIENLVMSKNLNVSNYVTNVNIIKGSLNDYDNTISLVSSKLNNQYKTYFNNIRNYFNQAISKIKNEHNYQNASDIVTTAYLDNFEYLEPPIEKLNSTLKVYTELSIREQLRSLIDKHAPIQQIESLMNKINDSLSVEEKMLSKSSTQNIFNNLTNSVNPNVQVTKTDINALKSGFGVYAGERKAMGNSSEAYKTEVRNNIDNIRLKLIQVLNFYSSNNPKQAFIAAQSAYLDSYENIEIPLRPINPDFVLNMEIKFAELRNLINSNSPFSTIKEKITEIQQGLDESERLVSGTGIVAPTIAFSSSFSIIFREGLESALILGAILTYLEATRNDQYKKYVYYGILLGFGLTGLTWFVTQYIIEISGASTEMIEAIAGLSAVGILFWVSFWVLNKIETKKWIEFVKAKVWKATTTGSVSVFIMLAFISIYREGFETVLFYQALLAFAKYMETYVISGFVIGLVAILGIVFLMRRLGKKLPLRVLFGLTMAVGAYMSITFMGNAIQQLQGFYIIPTTPLFGIIPRLDINLAEMTGIHPTLETVLGQAILLAIYIIGSAYILVIHPRKKQTIAAMRKSVKDRSDKISPS